MYSTRFSSVPTSSPYYSSTYTYQSTPASPAGAYYYTASYETTPGKSKHKRHATADGYAYTSPQGPTFCYVPAEDAKPKRQSSHRHKEHVSGHRHSKSKAHAYPAEAYGQSQYRRGYEYQYAHPSQSKHYAYTGRHADPRTAEYDTTYDRKYRTSPPPEDRRQYYDDPRTNARSHRQTTYTYTYERAQPQPQPQSRPQRSASYSAKQAPPRPQPPPAAATERVATEADARRAGIPAGYSTKHWDPREEPILLLGSVFDANSLGKWIYDWTVATHGSTAPLTQVAGDLWLLLIDLSGKIKRAEEKVGRVTNTEDKELINEFLDSGERIWQRFSKLLKVCESYMLKAGKKSSSSRKVKVGQNSGVEFVKCIFGRDRELEKTEKLMVNIRLWSMRFDANCEDILRHA